MAKEIIAKADKTLYITNTSSDQGVSIALYPDNGLFTIPAKASIAVTVDSAREYLFYLAQATKENIVVSESEVEEGLLFLAVKDAQLVITNKTANVVAISLYPDTGLNQYTFEPGDVLKVTVKTAREYMFYNITAQTAGLTVEESM